MFLATHLISSPFSLKDREGHRRTPCPQGGLRTRVLGGLPWVGNKSGTKKNTLITSWKINMEPKKEDHVERKFNLPTINFSGICYFSGGTSCKMNILNLKHGGGWKILFFCNSVIYNINMLIFRGARSLKLTAKAPEN